MDGIPVVVYPMLARQVNYHLLSSFVFLLCDIVVTWKGEMKHIWSKPWNSFFKWLYLYLRYISLATQIFHQFAVPHLNSGEALRSTCFVWYTYTVILAQLHTTALEIILAVRVYALFNKSRRIAMVLGFHMTLEYIILVVVVRKYFPGIIFIPYCILTQPPYQVVYPTVAAVITQTTLVGLILMKQILTRRAGWRRTPLVSVLIRDGTVTYFILCAILFVVGSFCGLRDERTVILFFWIISVISSWGCRLIINLQCIAVNENIHSVSCPYITSQIEVEE